MATFRIRDLITAVQFCAGSDPRPACDQTNVLPECAPTYPRPPCAPSGPKPDCAPSDTVPTHVVFGPQAHTGRPIDCLPADELELLKRQLDATMRTQRRADGLPPCSDADAKRSQPITQFDAQEQEMLAVMQALKQRRNELERGIKARK